MIYRKRLKKGFSEKTRLVSMRLPESLLCEIRSKNLNLSYLVAELVRGYLYIQNNDSSCPLYGSSAFDPRSVKIDVYFKDSLDYEF